MRAVLIAGPTACGKSELAIRIARECSGEVISVDSCAVYRGMDIGSAKPTLAQREQVPHHLIDVRDPDQPYSAGAFLRDAGTAAREIAGRGRLPILCGGTMLYVKTLLDGLSRIPQIDPAQSKAAEELADRIGLGEAHKRLAQIDPTSARKIRPSDRQRIVRALAVHADTGRALSSWQEQEGKQQSGFSPYFIALIPKDRKLLAKRIAARSAEMFDAGLVDEVGRIIDKHGSDISSLRAVCYRQVCAHLKGEYGLDEAMGRVEIATRQLARRQLTWLRKLAERADLIADPLEEHSGDMLLEAVRAANGDNATEAET